MKENQQSSPARYLRRAFMWTSLLVTAGLLVLLAGAIQTRGQQTRSNPFSGGLQVPARPAGGGPAPAVAASDKPYIVQWVYKVKWGHADEYWQIFKKYQIAILNREKELGYVTSYTVYKPGLHTSEDSRWEFMFLIVYKNQAASGHGPEIGKQLFPDQGTFKREENHRWELVEAHWDLPIKQIDPNGDGSE